MAACARLGESGKPRSAVVARQSCGDTGWRPALPGTGVRGRTPPPGWSTRPPLRRHTLAHLDRYLVPRSVSRVRAVDPRLGRETAIKVLPAERIDEARRPVAVATCL